MASTIIPAYGSRLLTVAASGILATYSAASYTVESVGGYAPAPGPLVSVFSGTGANTTTAFTNATQVLITAGAQPVSFNTGTGPVIYDRVGYQPTPGTLNATGTLTGALIMGGIVTSTTAAAVVATLDTGAVLDALGSFAIGDCFDWTAINTGGANAFTVTASTGHTIVGAAAVAASTSGRFRTLKTAAATFVTYRL